MSAPTRRLACRGAFALAAGFLACGAGAPPADPSPPPAPPSDPDAELIELAAEHARLQAATEPLRRRFFALHPDDAALEAVAAAELALMDRQNPLVDRLRDLRAVTPAGCRAKAAVLRELFLLHHEQEIEESCLDEEDALAWSLVRDLLALPAGGRA